jgi:hypothetical protein
VGVGDGVCVGVGVVVGVCDTGMSALQSNIASKSTISQGFVVVVVVAHGPGVNPFISGQAVAHGILPNKIQSPPNVSDKHHFIPSKNK